MFQMVSHMLQAVECEVAAAANSVTAKKNSSLLPLSHEKQMLWFKLLDIKSVASSERISPKFANFVG